MKKIAQKSDERWRMMDQKNSVCKLYIVEWRLWDQKVVQHCLRSLYTLSESIQLVTLMVQVPVSHTTILLGHWMKYVSIKAFKMCTAILPVIREMLEKTMQGVLWSIFSLSVQCYQNIKLFIPCCSYKHRSNVGLWGNVAAEHSITLKN